MKSMAKALCLMALLWLPTMGAEAQEFNSTIEIHDFTPAADPVARMVTEIIRTRVASSGLIRVVEASESTSARSAEETDATMEGSVLEKGDVVGISYRLIENYSGRTIGSSAKEFPSAEIFTAATSIGADVGNKMLTTYFASGIADIRKLLAMRRFEEADRRLQVYRVRSGDSSETVELSRQISLGLAEEWYAKARTTLHAAASADDAYGALDAHDDAVAAVSLLPEGDRYAYLGPRLASFIGSDVAGEEKRQADILRGEIAVEAKRSLAAGDPQAAIKTLDDFLEIEGVRADSPQLENLRRTARVLRARDLARLALESARSGETNAAESFADRALSLAPGDDRVISLVTEEKRCLSDSDRAARDDLIAPGYPQSTYGRGDWELAIRPGFWVFGEGTLDLPFTGALPGIGIRLSRDLAVTDTISLRILASCEYADSRGAVSTQGFAGQLDQYFVKTAVGGGIAFHLEQWVLGADLSLGGGFFSFDGSYVTSSGTPGISGRRAALCANAVVDAEYYFAKNLSLGCGLGLEPSLIFGYGIVSCVPINLLLALSL